jgi:hypothetical protein
MTTLPLEMDMGSEDSEEAAELLELETGERLRENVCDHVVGRTISQHDMTVGDSLTDEMKVNIDMFGAAVECGILQKMDGTLVIAMKCSRYCKKKNRRKFSK